MGNVITLKLQCMTDVKWQTGVPLTVAASWVGKAFAVLAAARARDESGRLPDLGPQMGQSSSSFLFLQSWLLLIGAKPSPLCGQSYPRGWKAASRIG